MSEHLILDEQSHSQDAWEEERDDKGRITKPIRPKRDEKLLHVRLDRQFSAKLRLTKKTATGVKRHANIAKEAARVGLGQEIAPGIRIVEYECRLNEASEAMVTPEERDEDDNVVREESFSPAREESVEHVFTARIGNRDIAKTTLSAEEFASPNWRDALAARFPQRETWIG